MFSAARQSDGPESVVSVVRKQRKQMGDIVILMPEGDKWTGLLKSLNVFLEAFRSDGLRDNIPQERYVPMDFN